MSLCKMLTQVFYEELTGTTEISCEPRSDNFVLSCLQHEFTHLPSRMFFSLSVELNSRRLPCRETAHSQCWQGADVHDPLHVVERPVELVPYRVSAVARSCAGRPWRQTVPRQPSTLKAPLAPGTAPDEYHAIHSCPERLHRGNDQVGHHFQHVPSNKYRHLVKLLRT